MAGLDGAASRPDLRPEDLGIGQLFETIRDAVIVADAATAKILIWNRAAEAVFGWTPEEAIGQNIEMLVPDSLKPRHRAGIARYNETGHGPWLTPIAPSNFLPSTRAGPRSSSR